MSSKKNKPQYINSLPLGIDQYESQSQNKIADNLFELIQNNSSKNKLIGLDGSWGSGKSNIVMILKQKMADSHHFFIHDAWGHQEDLQRRSLLEELTEDLYENKLIECEIWKEKLKNLLAKKKETKTKIVPRLSVGFIVIFLVAVSTPILKIASEVLDSPTQKILLVSFPFLFGLCLWGLDTILKIVRIKKGKCISIKDLFFLYKDKELENEKSITISESEPSVRDFQNWIYELDEDLETCSLVIVFDNMDRLPPAKVMQLWSSIHTFFAETKKEFNNIWVIVPFDRIHIRNAFNNDEKKADHFINKTFSVVYRVSPPVLSDWQHFFELKFSEAFGNIEDSEFNITKGIFDRYTDSISPRNIIAFINELVTLKRLHKEEIALRYIAIFALTKEVILENPINEILDLNFIKKIELLFNNDDKLQDNISALVYQVPLESASQVALTRSIELSLRETNYERINELSVHPNFTQILEQVIYKDTIELDKSVLTLNELDKQKNITAKAKRQMQIIWETLLGKQLVEKIHEQNFNKVHKSFLLNISKDSSVKFIKYFLKSIRDVQEFNGKSYFITLQNLENFVEENKIDSKIPELVKSLNVEPKVFLEYLEYADLNFEKYKVKCNESNLCKYFIEKIPDELQDYNYLSNIKSKYNFQSVIDKIEELVDDDLITNENFESIYSLYMILIEDKPINLISDTKINEFLTTADINTNSYYILIAMRLARADSFPALSGITQSILNEVDIEFVEEISARIEYFIDYDDILLKIIEWDAPLLAKIAKNLTEKSYGTSRLNIVEILKNFKIIVSKLNINIISFINKINAWSGNAVERITAENITEIINDLGFFENGVNIDCGLTNHIFEKYIEHLNSLKVDKWLEGFHDDTSFLFNSVYWLLFSSKLKKLPNNAITSYKIILKEIANESFKIPSSEKWEKYHERINKNKLRPTIKDIRDDFVTHIDIKPNIFIFFSDMLVKLGSLKFRAADVTRRILTPILTNDECLKQILSNQESYIPIINKAGDDADNFKDVIRQKRDQNPNNEKLTIFAKNINLDT